MNAEDFDNGLGTASPALPPTEQVGPVGNLESRGTSELVAAMHEVECGVDEAVEAALPAVAAFVEALVPRLARGGRLFYIGAGTSGRLGIVDASECPPTFGVPPGRVVGLIAGGDAAIREAVEGAEDDAEALGDQRGGELQTPPEPMPPHVPQPETTPTAGRSALLPPEQPKPDVKPVSAGPRLSGPSTMPRPPLPKPNK